MTDSEGGREKNTMNRKAEDRAESEAKKKSKEDAVNREVEQRLREIQK